MTSTQRQPGRELRRARRESVAAALLEGPPPLDALDVHCIAVETASVLHPSTNRPVLRWVLTVESPQGRRSRLPVIGKGFLSGGGADAARLLQGLREAGFDGPDLSVPRPYGYDPARRLLTQEEAPPGTLYAMLAGEVREATSAVRRVARWLAMLHSVATVAPPRLPVDFERTKLTDYGAAIAARLPAAHTRVRSLAAATAAKLATAPAEGLVLTHGDFQPKNVHLSSSRLTVIDFDRAAMAPPARDLGHFVGQVETMGAALHGDLGAAAPWIEPFVEEYVERGGDARAVEGIPAYAARTFAEVLYYRLVIRPVSSTSFVPSWLDAWERHLRNAGPLPRSASQPSVYP